MLHTLPREVSADARLQPAGLHIIANIESDRRDLLNVSGPFRKFIDEAIVKNKLTKVGEAYHDFDGGGFTAVVCLAESHLSIHTWPSQGYATFDIFLSNFTSDNSGKGKSIYQDVVHFLDADVVFEKSLER